MEYKTAWDLAGDWSWLYDGNGFCVAGGRVTWTEANATRNGHVCIRRLVVLPSGALRTYTRYIAPDTEIEIVPLDPTNERVAE